jgi:hypothetical protein
VKDSVKSTRDKYFFATKPFFKQFRMDHFVIGQFQTPNKMKLYTKVQVLEKLRGVVLGTLQPISVDPNLIGQESAILEKSVNGSA